MKNKTSLLPVLTKEQNQNRLNSLYQLNYENNNLFEELIKDYVSKEHK